MAGSSRDPGPASRLVAANLKRIRQERGLSYAELARRLEAVGHPLADTALLKTEQGSRRASVDDLAALAVTLGVTPGRLLLPSLEPGTPAAGEDAPWGDATPPMLWSWSAGEVPLRSAPASAADDLAARAAEAAFIRENRQHLREVPAPAPPSSTRATVVRDFAVSGITSLIQDAFGSGLTTADIRAVVEAAIGQALASPDPAARPPRVEVGNGRVTVWATAPEPPAVVEAP